MIRHVVLFTTQKGVDKKSIYHGLSVLKGIPHYLHLEISINERQDDISQISPEVIVYGEFESDEQLELFKNHELYQRSIQLVRPLRDVRICVDFDAQSNPSHPNSDSLSPSQKD